MSYKIRIILNAEEDVIRDIVIRKSVTLEDLHNKINKAFDFSGDEMASFYRSDDEWNQGEEFPLFDMSEGLDSKTQMQDLSVEDVLKNKNDKLIYIYDFLNMWSFYVEVIDEHFRQQEPIITDVLFALGNIPKTAPDIQFESENLSLDDFDDEEDDEDDELDEFDFDEYMS
jgi:hypothetical protein